MNRPRIVDTPDGPALLIPAGPAREVASSIGRLLELRPQWAGPDRTLAPARRALIEVERLHALGKGFAPETDDERMAFPWLTVAEASASVGVTPQAFRKRLRLGRIPGAHWLEGHGWLIPADALPQLEHDDDDF